MSCLFKEKKKIDDYDFYLTIKKENTRKRTLELAMFTVAV
jgi:hypothetical protein